MSGIQIQTKTSQPIQAGEDSQITLVSQSVSRIDETWGAVWNRPAAVRVETDGVTQTIPIIDVTRIAQVVLWGLTAGFGFLAIRSFFKVRSKNNE